MKRFMAVALAAAAALALPAITEAKELAQAEICGADACTTITGAALDQLVGGGDGSSAAASPPGSFYRVTLTDKYAGASWSIFYVPGGGRLALPNGDWLRLTDQSAAAYREATAGLEPYPAPRLVEVLVNGRAAKDPASYVVLFTAGKTENAVPSSLPEWTPLHMRFTGESPWSGRPSIFFAPEYGVLQRGAMIVKIPDAMAESIRDGEGIGSARNGFPWATAAVIALALTSAAMLAALTLRRWPFPRGKRAPIAA